MGVPAALRELPSAMAIAALAGSNAAPIMIVSMIADGYVNARVSRVAAVRPQHRVRLAHPSWMLLSRVGVLSVVVGIVTALYVYTLLWTCQS